MRIAWYTPFSANSAIGHFSQLVVQALRNLDVEVLLVRSEEKTAAVRSVPPICRTEKWAWAADFNQAPQAVLASYDLIVYNLGDHHDFHAYCYRHQPQAPGLSILHDYSLHHAMLMYCHATAPANGSYRDHLHAECGVEVTAAYDGATVHGNEHHWWHAEIARHPVYRWAMSETLGVVTHADFYRATVAERLGCPTTTIPLAYDSPLSDDDAKPAGPRDKLTIVTVGAVNANKRYQAVIRALAESPLLRERCRYRIVGPADEPRQQLIATTLNAQRHRPDVTLTGRVDRKTLRQELQNADIISCLRYPALEGASASVIEGLLSGKPVIVCDTGCYQEIPDEAVFKVAPQREHQELTRALEQIVTQYDAACQRARFAQQWARQRHHPSAYAQQLLQFANQVLHNRPVLAIADRFANQLRRWNVPADEHLMRRLDLAMHDLFGDRAAEKRSAA